MRCVLTSSYQELLSLCLLSQKPTRERDIHRPPDPIECKTGVLSGVYRSTFLAGTGAVLGGALRLRLWVRHVGVGASPQHPGQADQLPHLSLPEWNHVFHARPG